MAYCGPRGIALDEFLSWSPKSQWAALDWMAYEGRRCKQCGTHPEEWADDKLAYHAHLDECVGCRQRQRLAEKDDAKREGVYAVMAAGGAADCARCKPMNLA